MASTIEENICELKQSPHANNKIPSIKVHPKANTETHKEAKQLAMEGDRHGCSILHMLLADGIRNTTEEDSDLSTPAIWRYLEEMVTTF